MLKKLLVLVGLGLVANAYAGHVFAAGNAEAGKAKSAVCAACHGADGISALPINPNLAGQVPGYIKAQLKAFQSGERANAVMAGQTISLSEEDMADLDAYYSTLTPNFEVNLTEDEVALAEGGKALYRGGFADRGIAACASCHGAAGHGIPIHYPRVSAQHREYLEQQLLAFKKGERKGHNEIMHDIAFGLSEQQIKELAAYMAGLN